MEVRKCYACKKCGGHHWHFLNAIECCQDLSEEIIKERRAKETANYLCVHCNKLINPKCKNCNGKGYVKNYGDNPRIPKFAKCIACSQKTNKEKKK